MRADQVRRATTPAEAARLAADLPRLARRLLIGGTGAEEGRVATGADGGLLAMQTPLVRVLVGRTGTIPARLRAVPR